MLKSKIYEKGVPSRNFLDFDFYSAHGRHAGESDWGESRRPITKYLSSSSELLREAEKLPGAIGQLLVITTSFRLTPQSTGMHI